MLISHSRRGRAKLKSLAINSKRRLVDRTSRWTSCYPGCIRYLAAFLVEYLAVQVTIRANWHSSFVESLARWRESPGWIAGDSVAVRNFVKRSPEGSCMTVVLDSFRCTELVATVLPKVSGSWGLANSLNPPGPG